MNLDLVVIRVFLLNGRTTSTAALGTALALVAGSPMREPRVLVIEDDPDVQALVCSVAKRQGVTIDRAQDGEEAIRLLGANTYDVIVLDLMLPKVNGFRVAEVVRELNVRPRLIVFSAISRYFAEMFPEAVILQKPFDLARLEDIFAGKARRAD